MAWSYHKHIKIIPGVLLHIGRNGINASIEQDSAGWNIETAGSSPAFGSSQPSPVTLHGIQQHDGRPAAGDNIFSADVQEITSKGMQGIKDAMLMSYNQRHQLRSDLKSVQRTLTRTRLKYYLSRLLLYGLINRSISQRIADEIAAQEAVIRKISEQIVESAVRLRIEFEPPAREQYERVIQAFKKLMTSRKIWDVTSAHYQDRVAARSSASTVVQKKEVKFSLSPLPGISAAVDVLHFQNANGPGLYFYPGFIVMQSAPGNFALIGIDELVFNHGAVRFTETGPVPDDSAVIDRTWAKVNKNGTPDRRFKSNYQIPIVRYEELRLKTATGLHEEYECSNYEATEAFGLAFGAYQRYLRTISPAMQAN